jgi:ankyrin repeat protein
MDIVSFKPQEEWWTSAEVALEMLEKERKSLTRSMATKETLPQRIGAGLVSTNRYITTKIKELVKGADAEKKQQFRDGIEEISHVLPQDTQREFHRRTCLAAKDGNLEELQSLLKFQVDLDRTDAFGTPLHYACYNSKLEAAQMILDHGAYAGVPNMRDETPLHIAAQNASGECIDILIHYGARVNAVTAAGWSAIHFAAKEGHTKLVQKLILGGADVDLGTKVGWTPLHIAAMGMHHQTMDMLLNQGMADPNSRCTHTSHLGNPGDEEYEIFRSVAGDTPAHFAARKGHYMCLKTLLHYGVDLGGVNEMGETLAHCAVESGEIRILELLLEHGAQFLAVDDKKGNDSVDFCDKVILKYMGPQHEEIRNKLIKIKDVLVKMTQKRKHQLHRELIEKARENLGGRKKKTRDDSVPQQSEMEKEIDDLEIDEKTLEEKLTAMRLELEASRAAHKQLEMQTKGKTHELNETLLEMSRQLAETQYELGRERKVRQQLEEGILTTLRSHVHADKDSKGGSGQDPEEEFDRELEAGDGSGKPLYPDDDDRGAGRDDPYSQPPDVLRIREFLRPFTAIATHHLQHIR